MRTLYSLSLIGVLSTAGCTPEPCTVTDNGDGSYALTCPDGTSATIGNGVDGAAWLVSTADEPAGDNCPDGGQAVSVGPDTNGDGQLSADEVASTTYVCDGGDGVSYLVDVQDEPPGDNCFEGGISISVGPDTNRNGTLDSDEVVSTDYVCDGLNGADGADGEDAIPPLIRVDAEPEGDNCADGGLAVHTGIDDDKDGALSDTEIDDTSYVCDGADGEDGEDGADGADGADAFTVADFPSSGSTTLSGSSTGTVGSSGVPMYRSGDYVEETFSGTGTSSVDFLSFTFIINDRTTTYCTVGTLTYDIKVNSTKVGSVSFKGGTGGTNITISDSFVFPAVAGTGTSSDTYTLRIEATNTVCPGGSSWKILPGGKFFLR